MAVTGLTIDPVNNTPIVVLGEEGGDRILPIWIGVIEASSIAFELEKVKLTRPMTHDLLKTVIEALSGSVTQVVIVDLRDNTYYAVIEMSHAEQTLEIDARPSDAIALALRSGAPILCEPHVLDRAQLRQEESAGGPTEHPAATQPGGPGPQHTDEEEDEDRGEGGPKPIVDVGSRSWLEVLEGLDPKAFGKYKM
jgi:bifunctional DNase/RNase